MLLQLTASRPQSPSFDATINPETLNCGAQINEPGALSMTLRGQLAGYLDEYLSSNPVQTNAYLKLRDVATGAYIWRGYIIGRTVRRAGGGKYSITVSATDLLGKIARCAASHSGVNIGELFKTAALALGSGSPVRISLLQLKNSTPYDKWFYPDPTATPPWHPYAAPYEACNSTLGANAAAAAVTLTSGLTMDRGLLPAGLCKIFGSNEYFYYDGWDPDGSGFYTWKNCLRSALGTTAAGTTNAGTKVWQALPKRIHPDVVPLLEGYAGGTTWETIDPGNYAVKADEGRFEFRVNPLTTALTPPLSALPTALRAAYSVFDEASATAWVLGGDGTYGVVEQLLKETVLNGGPGLSAGQMNILIDRLAISRVNLDSPLLLREALDSLLNNPGDLLLRNVAGVESALLGLWYDHANGQVNLQPLPRSSNAIHYLGARESVEDIDMRDVLSGIIVSWQDDYDEAQPQKSLLVSLTGSYSASDNSGKVFRAAPYAKLIDANMGQPRLDKLGLGSSSRGAAASIARGKLIQSTRLVRSREYMISGNIEDLPALGANAQMPDGYSGTLAEWNLGLSRSGGRSLRLRVVNLTESYR